MKLPRPKIIDASPELASKEDYQTLYETGEIVNLSGSTWVIVRGLNSFLFHEVFIVDKRD